MIQQCTATLHERMGQTQLPETPLTTRYQSELQCNVTLLCSTHDDREQATLQAE